ncbi:hypothetical protein VOLCADRAFT_99717 [Volvox carteri f. nagariensis]|uniref:Uncharacterized protein n=1 Tax=Volvox carteri f. nagariensis TaxID=3068 RepID=D8UIG6_VOLCA|nr:uncharacterized protein VOLCADRAFT_99717 [Volvox carteri f. nagariensis]EFJ40449.1 hypothetical protein VOLCADRAFT_99717 [Volvox carteri f. nagariensis]|eukprot:XP_002958449.1 hypothetical protein VOLCADRAFT_99717 [Volvox carteri f. nagariensis]
MPFCIPGSPISSASKLPDSEAICAKSGPMASLRTASPPTLPQDPPATAARAVHRGTGPNEWALKSSRGRVYCTVRDRTGSAQLACLTPAPRMQCAVPQVLAAEMGVGKIEMVEGVLQFKHHAAPIHPFHGSGDVYVRMKVHV